MKELYIKPEVEILLPLCEDIMTSSGDVPGGSSDPANPDAALPSVPSGSGGSQTPGDTDTDPAEENKGGISGNDNASLDH